MKHFLHKCFCCFFLVSASFLTVLASQQVYASDAKYSLPFNFGPASQAQFDECFVIDSNHDGVTWTFSDGSFKYSYNEDLAGDDWIILPAVNFGDAGKVKLSLEAKTQGASFAEAFQVCIGSEASVSQMGEPIINVTDRDQFKSNSWKTFDVEFESEGGIRYIGLHAVSPADRYGLYLRNIKVESNGSGSDTPVYKPSLPRIISAECDGFNMTAIVQSPSTFIDGSQIDAPITIIMNLDGAKSDEKNDVNPGEQITFIKELSEGSHILEFIAIVAYDGIEYMSDPASSTVRTQNVSGAYTLPFLFGPSSQEEIDEECQIVDANWDGVKWHYKDGALYYAYSEDYDANDWIFLPAVNFGNASQVKISVEARTEGDRYPEAFEVRMGREPAAGDMDYKVIEVDNFKSKDNWQTFENERYTSGGIWYIGIHAVSPADSYGLYIRNIRIEDLSPEIEEPGIECPMAPEIVSVSCEGLVMTAVVKAPLNNIDGEEISTAMTIRMNIDDDPVEDKTEIDAGNEVSFVRELTEGTHQLSFSAIIMEDGKEYESERAVSTVTAEKEQNNGIDSALSAPDNISKYEYYTVDGKRAKDATQSGILIRIEKGKSKLIHRP